MQPHTHPPALVVRVYLPLEIWVDTAIVLCRGVVDALRNQGRYSSERLVDNCCIYPNNEVDATNGHASFICHYGVDVLINKGRCSESKR